MTILSNYSFWMAICLWLSIFGCLQLIYCVFGQAVVLNSTSLKTINHLFCREVGKVWLWKNAVLGDLPDNIYNVYYHCFKKVTMGDKKYKSSNWMHCDLIEGWIDLNMVSKSLFEPVHWTKLFGYYWFCDPLVNLNPHPL